MSYNYNSNNNNNNNRNYLPLMSGLQLNQYPLNVPNYGYNIQAGYYGNHMQFPLPYPPMPYPPQFRVPLPPGLPHNSNQKLVPSRRQGRVPSSSQARTTLATHNPRVLPRNSSQARSSTHSNASTSNYNLLADVNANQPQASNNSMVDNQASMNQANSIQPAVSNQMATLKNGDYLVPQQMKTYTMLPTAEARIAQAFMNFDMKYPTTYFNKPPRKRKNGTQQPIVPPPKKRVYIFDLNDVLIPDIKVFGHARILAFNEAEKMRARAQQLWSMDMITYIGQTFFFKNDLENYGQSNVEDVAEDDNLNQDLSNYDFTKDGFYDIALYAPGTHPSHNSIGFLQMLAYRYRMIRDTYQNFQSWQREQNEVGDAKERCARNKERMMAGPAKMWLDLSTAILDVISNKSNTKIVICTNSELSEAASKLVVFGLDRYVDITDVYSSGKVGKSSVYDRIKKEYGDKNSYVVIGTVDSKHHAEKSNITFLRVGKMDHLKLFKHFVGNDIY